MIRICAATGKLVSDHRRDLETPSVLKTFLQPAAVTRRTYQKKAKRKEPDTIDPGFLRRAKITKGTLIRYQTSLLDLARFGHLQVSELARLEGDALDDLVEACLENMFNLKRGRSAGNYMLAALAFERSTSMRNNPTFLPKARSALRGWRVLEPDASKLPLPWSHACLLARVLSTQGPVGWQAAAALTIQFDLMLRPGELLAIVPETCLLPSKGGESYRAAGVIVAPSSAVLDGRLTPSKTSEFDDTVLFDDASFPGVPGVFLEAFRRCRRCGGDRLFHLLTYPTYRKLLAEASVQAGLPDLVTPHMARHGGASEFFHRSLRGLLAIQFRGRWRSTSSVQRYGKTGRLLTAAKRAKPAVVAAATAAEKTKLGFLHHKRLGFTA